MLQSSRLASLFAINSSDEDVRQRGRNIMALAWGLVVLVLLVSIINLFRPEPLRSLGANLVPFFCALGALLLARRGLVTVAAIMLVAFTAVGIATTLLILPGSGAGMFFLVIPLLIAGCSLTLRGQAAAFGMVLLILALLAIIAPLDRIVLDRSGLLLRAGVVLVFTGLFMLLNSLGVQRMVHALRVSRDQLAQAAAAQEQANATLEARIAERTDELSQALATQEAQAQQLRGVLKIQQQLHALVEELSLPILPVRDSVLVAPLIGLWDQERTEQLLPRVTAQIEQHRARIIILDITGIPVLDQTTALCLIQAAQAARTLGARALLVGVRPEVAQTLVGLELDLASLSFYASLQQALAELDGLPVLR